MRRARGATTMDAPGPERPGTARLGPERLGIGRLAALGLAVAGLGWVLLLGKSLGAEAAAAHGSPVLAAVLRNDGGEIAHSLVDSGFALAVVGALQNGFGALNRFFATVLARSNGRAARPEVAPQPATGPTHDARPYRTLPDGSVEVETIVGTRRFATMVEARDFI